MCLCSDLCWHSGSCPSCDVISSPPDTSTLPSLIFFTCFCSGVPQFLTSLLKLSTGQQWFPTLFGYCTTNWITLPRVRLKYPPICILPVSVWSQVFSSTPVDRPSTLRGPSNPDWEPLQYNMVPLTTNRQPTQIALVNAWAYHIRNAWVTFTLTGQGTVSQDSLLPGVCHRHLRWNN
jgi:hypothetical protein